MQNRVVRRDFLASLAGVAVAASVKASARQGPPPRFMYIGSFTGGGRGHGEGISVYTRKGEPDPWTLVQVLKDFADPSFLAIDRQGRFLYSSHGAGTRVTSYQIDQSSG